MYLISTDVSNAIHTSSIYYFNNNWGSILEIICIVSVYRNRGFRSNFTTMKLMSNGCSWHFSIHQCVRLHEKVPDVSFEWWYGIRNTFLYTNEQLLQIVIIISTTFFPLIMAYYGRWLNYILLLHIKLSITIYNDVTELGMRTVLIIFSN